MNFKVGDMVRTKPMKITTISDIDRETPGRPENIFYQLENTSIHRADDLQPLPTQPNDVMREALQKISNEGPKENPNHDVSNNLGNQEDYYWAGKEQARFESAEIARAALAAGGK